MLNWVFSHKAYWYNNIKKRPLYYTAGAFY